MTFAAKKHEEMKGQVEVTRRTLCTIEHYLMVHARVLEAYIYFELIYTADNIFPFLPIKYLINEDSELTTPFKFVTGIKTSVSHLRVIFPCAQSSK